MASIAQSHLPTHAATLRDLGQGASWHRAAVPIRTPLRLRPFVLIFSYGPRPIGQLEVCLNLSYSPLEIGNALRGGVHFSQQSLALFFQSLYCVLTAEAAKAFAPLVRVARLLGCDKNAAAISANQAIYSMTNINLMQQLGHTHLEAEKQDSHWYTATELGKQMTPAVSARQVNLLLAEAGLQFKRGDVWEATEAGKDFARIYDTGKRHGSGVAVTQMKWSATVLAVLQALPLESKEAA